MTAHPTILVFDSGLGGLTVYREIVAVRPDADFVYFADDAGFPYNALAENTLVARVVGLFDELIASLRPNLAVIACNTASTITLPALREKFALRFVGTVPAIKPACAASVTRRVSVLGTQATVAREYTRALIRDFANDCQVTLVGSNNLAPYVEAELAGAAPASDAQIRAEIAPCFVDDGQRTDTVVLACTHYPLLRDRLTRLAPWPVNYIDPAPAIARRVLELVGPPAPSQRGNSRAIFTSGHVPHAVLARFGIEPHPAAIGRADQICWRNSDGAPAPEIPCHTGTLTSEAVEGAIYKRISLKIEADRGKSSAVNEPPLDQSSDEKQTRRRSYSMTNLVWRSTLGGPTQVNAPKVLTLAFNTPQQPAKVMSAALNALQSMNQGQLWSGTPIRPFPEGGPEAVEVQASGKYTGSQDRLPSSHIALQLVCQKHISMPQVALHMTFTDQPSVGSVLPWMDGITESIVAVTALHIRKWISNDIFNQPLSNPTQNWTWHSGAWLNPQTVEFFEWSIDLSR